VAPGAYPFGIYLWERRGLRDDAEIVPVCLDDGLRPHLHQLLGEATDGEGEPADPLPPGAAEAIEGEHYSLWRAAREAHRSQTGASVDTRRQSLETSQHAREVQLQDLIDRASDGRIQRLHQGALRNARTYFDRQLESLDKAADQAELVFQRVALGVMVIKGGVRRCRHSRTDTTGT
jgi:ATP-dependent helicase HepA